MHRRGTAANSAPRRRVRPSICGAVPVSTTRSREGCALSQATSFMSERHRFAAVPDRALARRLRRPRHRGLVVRREGDEVAVAQDLDRRAAARRTAASSSAARRAPRHGRRRMRACSTLSGTMSCTNAAPATFSGRSSRGSAACRRRDSRDGRLVGALPVAGRARSTSRASDPVVEPGLLAAAQDTPVVDRKLGGVAAELPAAWRDEQRAHLGADQAHGGARTPRS